MCRGCGMCVSSAPPGAIRMEKGIAEVNLEKCNDDDACVNACPFGVIQK